MLTEIYGHVQGIKPVLDAHTLSLSGLDARTRDLEIGQGAHGVKIDRINSDLDGIGRKLRRAPQSGDRSALQWLAVAAFLAENWHLLAMGGTLATTALVVLWRHWPR